MKKNDTKFFILVVIVIICVQIFGSCTSTKMTQAEIAEYYKDLKITGKGTGSYSAKTERIEPFKQQQQQQITIEQTKTPLLEEQQSTKNSTLIPEAETSLIATVNTDEIILAKDFDLSENNPDIVLEPTESHIPPTLQDAKAKMERLRNDVSLTKKERRVMKREVRKTVVRELRTQKKAIKEAKRNGQGTGDDKVIRIILAFLLPPASVAIGRGIDNTFWLNVILTLLFILPGIIHALIVIGEDY